MKHLLALLVALFAISAAVPASATHQGCHSGNGEMAQMAMPDGTDDGSMPCCDGMEKACAAVCATMCAAPAAFQLAAVDVGVYASGLAYQSHQISSWPSRGPPGVDHPPKSVA